jgi:hypothetical protein
MIFSSLKSIMNPLWNLYNIAYDNYVHTPYVKFPLTNSLSKLVQYCLQCIMCISIYEISSCEIPYEMLCGKIFPYHA